MKKLLFALLLLVVTLTSALAQNGYLRGKVSDAETGETLLGSTISKEGTTIGTVADFDGNYSLPLTAGTHTIVFQSVSYQTKTIKNVNIIAGEVTTLDVNLTTDVGELAEVVITAEAIRDSEAGILAMQKKSAVVLDGMSSQTFKKIGASDLSAAIKRVTGVSVQSGKYVYVRGLGGRYTRTTLNGMSIPGLDPERNDVQIDLFPTSVLENVVVYKTFSPELSGDFTGGMVNIETKSFPEEKITRVSLGVGYNPEMNLINKFVLYDGGSTDALGFDDGTRKLPLDNPTADVPSPYSNDPELESLTRSLGPQMATKRKQNFLNTSFSFNHGNQIDKGSYKIGYGVVLKYQNQFEYYNDSDFGFYTKHVNPDIYNLDPQVLKRNVELGRNSVLWSGLLTGAIKFDKHEFGATLMRTQNGISEATDRLSIDVEETSQTVYEDILTYTQRSITSPSITGKHNFNSFLLEWSNAYTISRIYDPDFRTTQIAQVSRGAELEPLYSIDGGDGGGVRRFWRDLNEDNENFKIDATYEVEANNKIKFGGAGVLKWREFNTYAFQLRNRQPIENDPDFLLQPENIWTPETEAGTYFSGNYEPANNYEARSSVYAAYIMNDIFLTEKFRAIYGVRVEKANMFYTGQNNFGTVVYDKEKTLDKIDWLPSVNLVYNLNDHINVRASYGRTLARPSFREKSIAQILDPVAGIRYNGNINLKQTSIDNFDLRFENFFGRNEMVSISAYYKRFDGAIEMVRYQVNPFEVTWQNTGRSEAYGLELEFRKNLDFVLNGLSTGSNLSWTQSRVDMNDIIVNAATGTTELEARRGQARTGEKIKETRDMAGQAPYLINAFLNYADNAAITNINLSYNVQGESLFIVGVAEVPDVYARPFHSLNLNLSRQFRANGNSQITLSFTNILGDKKEQVWKNYEARDEINSRFDPGRTFSLKYSYSF